MAASLRLSGAITPKSLLIEALTPRRLGGSTPKGFLSVASPFHIKYEDATPTSGRRHVTPNSSYSTTASTFHIFSTPKTPIDTSAAARLLSTVVAANVEEEITSTPPQPTAGYPFGLGLDVSTPDSYPRLLGRRSAPPIVPPAAVESCRRVRFNDDVSSEVLAEAAQAAFSEMKQRIANRKLLKSSASFAV